MISGRLRGLIGLAFHRQQGFDQRLRRRRQTHPSAADHPATVAEALHCMRQIAPVQPLQLAIGEGIFGSQVDGAGLPILNAYL